MRVAQYVIFFFSASSTPAKPSQPLSPVSLSSAIPIQGLSVVGGKAVGIGVGTLPMGVGSGTEVRQCTLVKSGFNSLLLKTSVITLSSHSILGIGVGSAITVDTLLASTTIITNSSVIRLLYTKHR